MKKLFLFLFFTPTILLAQSLDVLFIGNSYTYANNMPQMVSELALSFGDTLILNLLLLVEQPLILILQTSIH